MCVGGIVCSYQGSEDCIGIGSATESLQVVAVTTTLPRAAAALRAFIHAIHPLPCCCCCCSSCAASFDQIYIYEHITVFINNIGIYKSNIQRLTHVQPSMVTCFHMGSLWWSINHVSQWCPPKVSFGSQAPLQWPIRMPMEEVPSYIYYY